MPQKPSPDAAYVTAAQFCSHEQDARNRRNLVKYARSYLRGEFEFFGLPHEGRHRQMLELSGVDVEAMLRVYHTRM